MTARSGAATLNSVGGLAVNGIVRQFDLAGEAFAASASLSVSAVVRAIGVIALTGNGSFFSNTAFFDWSHQTTWEQNAWAPGAFAKGAFGANVWH